LPDDGYPSADFFPGSEIFCNVSPFSGKEMGMRLLNSGFTEFTPQDFYDKGIFIVARLTGNTYYATTTPTLAAIQTQLTALETALKMPPGMARDGASPRRVRRWRNRCRTWLRTSNRRLPATSRRSARLGSISAKRRPKPAERRPRRQICA
jgi:hypothetical protein